ncbi:MAG: hypothetical protein R3D25_02535 [Geminicoccaceae bacterium]
MRVVVLIGSLGLLALAACTARVTPPKIEVEAKSPVEIEVGSDSGKFCPPGQAKKGRC